MRKHFCTTALVCTTLAVIRLAYLAPDIINAITEGRHCKNDRKVRARNWLKGRVGDKINAIAMAIGFNMRNILRKMFLWLFKILLSFFNPRKYQGQNGLF